MVDWLAGFASLIVAFVFFALVKLLFAFKHLYEFFAQQFRSPASSLNTLAHDRVSHSWSEAAAVSTRHADICSHDKPWTSDLKQHDAELDAVDCSEEDDDDNNLISQKINEIMEAYKTAWQRQNDLKISASVDKQRSTGSKSCYKYVQFSNDFGTALKQDLWNGRLVCVHCEVSLSGERYVVRRERPYCKTCYEALFANNCDKCKSSINFDSKDLSYENKHWHEQCFACTGCQTLLANQLFVYKDGYLYCQICYETRLCSHCSKCGKEFQNGMKKYGYKGRQWHDECFTCSVCCDHIGKNPFVSRGKTRDLICITCFESLSTHLTGNLQNCVKCKQVIQSEERVDYKDLSWHRRCFACTHCKRYLSNAVSFILIDSQLLCCNECRHEIYDKKCATAPIVEIQSSPKMGR